MEQENKTDWDSESNRVPPKLQPVGISDQEEWDDDDQIDMGNHPAVADEPPVVEYSRIEGANSGVEVPTINTHLPDHTHFSTPDSSPVQMKIWVRWIPIVTNT